MDRLQDKYSRMSLSELEKHNIAHWNGKLGNRIRFLETHIADLEHCILALQSSVGELQSKI